MKTASFETLFERICKETPSPSDLRALHHHPDRQAVISFLTGRMDALGDAWDNDDEDAGDLEWGVIHSIQLLKGMQAPEAILPTIRALDLVIDDWEAMLHDAAMLALAGAGEQALEPLYERYLRDQHDPERKTTWLWALSDIGVSDPRITCALVAHTFVDPVEALSIMGGYRDPRILPVIEELVNRAAGNLNERQIDPMAPGMRLNDPVVDAYIEGRETLVVLRDGLDFLDPDLDTRVIELDIRLLKFCDFQSYAIRRAKSLSDLGKATKVGRNEPCPCGSGKKYKRCCGKV